MAEVLITLAIIGVVAALTIPTLISNYQKNQYVTQLKKNYNVIQNGFRQYLATQGVTKLTDTKFNRFSSNLEFQNEFAKIFKTPKHNAFFESNNMAEYLYNLSFLNKSGKWNDALLAFAHYTFIFTDGSFVTYDSSYKNNEVETGCKIKGPYIGAIYIDVNGFKKPNKWGRDIFGFFLDNQGILIPLGSRDEAICSWGDETMNWNSTDELANCRVDTTSVGYGCAGRIIEEGWKMTY